MKKMKKFLALAMVAAMVLSTGVTASAAAKTPKGFVSSAPATSEATIVIEGLAGEDYEHSQDDTKGEAGTTDIDLYSLIIAYDVDGGRVEYDLDPWVKDAIKADTSTGGLKATYWSSVKDDDGKDIDVFDVEKVIKDLGGEVPKAGGQQTYSIPKNDANSLLAKLHEYFVSNKSTILAATNPKKLTRTYDKDKLEETDAATTTAIAKQKATFDAVIVGYYLVLPTDANNVYNPMSVAVGLTANATTGAFDGVKAQTTKGKFSNIPFTKKQYNVGSDDKRAATDGIEKVSGDYQVGDWIEYEIETVIPNYDATTYKKFTFKIEDVLDDGLTGPKEKTDLTMTLGTDTYTEDTDKDNTNITIDSDQHGFTIDLTASIKADLKKYAGKSFKVVYRAQVNEDALTGFDPNNNTATLTFERTPNVDDTKEQKTYAYSFAIDGNVFANWKTNGWELKKTKEDTWVHTATDYIESEKKALDGAKFTLYEVCADTVANKVTLVPASADGKTPAVYGIPVAESKLKGDNPYTTANGDGRITFEGLDGVKKDANKKPIGNIYYIKETEAPSGYSLNTTVTSFYFDPTYDTASGKLKSYKVFINGTQAFEYTADTPASPTAVTIDNGTVLKYTDKGAFDGLNSDLKGTTEIKNTKLASLPSTGGIGTTIFTVAGILIMIAAAAIFFAARKKKA